MTKLFKTLFIALFAVSYALPPFGTARAEDTTSRYRALLVACDTFVSAPEMTPIGENNLLSMERMLAQDTRGFEIRRQYGITSSKETLAYAIKWAFGDATESDVSLLYLSTHGDFITSHNNPHSELLLSDGSLEDKLTAEELNQMLDAIPGMKVLLVDSCNSGALIGKGVSPDVGSARVARTFQDGQYKVLTSSGASEPSWYRVQTLENAPPGSSYFTTAMAVGAGLIGGYAADANRDGVITLKEMYDYLWINQASSAVQMFPQDDDFPLFCYDKGRLVDGAATKGELAGFVFGPTALEQGRPIVSFGYTATVDTNVAYHITYHENGEWDWARGVTIRDTSEFDGDADPLGNVTPGRKEVLLDLSDILPDEWTYAMIHVMTVGNPSEGRQPYIYASRVLRAEKKDADPRLAVRASRQWRMKTRPELEIFVAHSVPCQLTVFINDAGGNLIRRLVTSRPTRPEALTPEGSLLYWNGFDAEGNAAPPGDYEIVAQTRVGDTTYEARTTVTIAS